MFDLNKDPILHSPEKPLLILDLDETTVYCTKFKFAHPFDLKLLDYYVYSRPFLKEFLLKLSEYYSFGVWSSAADYYIDRVASDIFPNKIQIDFLWGRKKCTIEGDKNAKNPILYKEIQTLSKFYPTNRILILEDNPFVCKKNKNNSIILKAFTGEIDDKELQKLLPFLVSISNEPNFELINK